MSIHIYIHVPSAHSRRTQIYTNIHTYPHTNTPIRIHTYTTAFSTQTELFALRLVVGLHAYIHTNIHIQLSTSSRQTYVQTYIQVCMYTYTYNFPHTYTYTIIHTYTTALRTQYEPFAPRLGVDTWCLHICIYTYIHTCIRTYQ